MGKLSAVDVEIFYTSIISTDPQTVCTLGRRGDIRYIIGNQTMRILRIVQIGDEFLFVIVVGI